VAFSNKKVEFEQISLLRQEFRSDQGCKGNFTDADFKVMGGLVGTGRRLASVIRRAWELGAEWILV